MNNSLKTKTFVNTNKCFLDLLTNKEYQKIILEKTPYGQQHEFEPYEVLFKLINKDKILFNWSDPLKDGPLGLKGSYAADN